jgi:hypothetical protein
MTARRRADEALFHQSLFRVNEFRTVVCLKIQLSRLQHRFPPFWRAEIDSSLLTLGDVLSNKVCGSLSARLDLAIDIHVMITVNEIQPLQQAICAFSLSSLSATVDTERLRAAALIRECISHLTRIVDANCEPPVLL